MSADTLIVDSNMSTAASLIFAIVATAVDGCACVRLSSLYSTSAITCMYVFCGFFVDTIVYHAVSADSVYVFGKYKIQAVEPTLENSLIKYASSVASDSDLSLVNRATASSVDFLEFYSEYSQALGDIYNKKLSYVYSAINTAQRLATATPPTEITDLSKKFIEVTSLPLTDEEHAAIVAEN